METIDLLHSKLDRIESLLTAQKKVLNFDEAAIHTGLSKSHLYKKTSTGGIPCYKPTGKHIYFDREELDRWLLQGRRATTDEIEQRAADYMAGRRAAK